MPYHRGGGIRRRNALASFNMVNPIHGTVAVGQFCFYSRRCFIRSSQYVVSLSDLTTTTARLDRGRPVSTAWTSHYPSCTACDNRMLCYSGAVTSFRFLQRRVEVLGRKGKLVQLASAGSNAGSELNGARASCGEEIISCFTDRRPQDAPAVGRSSRWTGGRPPARPVVVSP